MSTNAKNIPLQAAFLAAAIVLPASGQTTQPATMVATQAKPGHSYWKYQNAAIILDVWPCPETTLCAKIHTVDLHDSGAIAMAKFLWQRDGKFGHPTGTVTDAEVQQVCGYPQVFRDMQLLSGTPKGDFQVKGSAIYHALIDRIDNPGTSNGVTLDRRGEDLTITTRVHHIPIGKFVHVDHLKLLAEPPPACVPPLPHLAFK